MKKTNLLLMSLVMWLVGTAVAMAQNQLPSGAEEVGQGYGYKAYTVETGKTNAGGEPQKELWLRNAEGKVGRLFTTSTTSQSVDWSKSARKDVSAIEAIDAVYFIQNIQEKKAYMVVQGCPDSRNIYVYLMPVSFSPKTALFIPAADGFVGLNETDNTLNCASYTYDQQEGRISLLVVYDFNGKLLNTRRVADDAEMDGRGPDEEGDGSDEEAEGDDCDGEYINTHELIYDKLDWTFKVWGNPNIQSFCDALPMFDADFWDECEYTLDKANGYFSFSEEGDGSIRYDAAIWNRKDGTKLFIISWRECETIVYQKDTEKLFGTQHAQNPWFKYDVVGEKAPNANVDGMAFRHGIDTGCRAFTYDKETSTLGTLEMPPFNKMPNTKAHRFLELPQKGKDIKVHEVIYHDDLETTEEVHTLKWNGDSFDYIK